MAESSSALRRSENARKERNLDPGFIDSQAIIFLVEGNNKNNVVNKITILLNVENVSKTYKEVITSRFTSRQGVDYFDTYTPVARITSIRVLFALASIYNLPIHQMDVKTAFLNGDLDEEVYMKQPEGFVLPGNENKVCKLMKYLYVLKQVPKQWHDKFDKSILLNGFTHNSSDRCIYSKFTEDYGVILCLYVYDILIVGTNMKGINETKKFLSSCFQMKDMNEVDTIFGIKVKRHSGGYAVNQYHYIDKIIDKFRHLYIEEANTPYESSCKLVENDGRAIAKIEYASAIGCLMYDTHCIRPDIAYVI
ncbi:zinc finger, CCHC-type containing protein [Tanacetum coccineum]